MPAVVLTGARQTGKRTLVQARHPSRRYLTLDGLDVQAAAGNVVDVLIEQAQARARGPGAPPDAGGARSSILVVHVAHVLVPA